MLKWLIFPMLMLTAQAADLVEQWDRKPAEDWRQAFALRGGPWGARVFGGSSLERIAMFRSGPGFDCVSPQIECLVMNWLNHEQVTSYRRSLDRPGGIATTSFQRNGARFTETVFLSKAESLLAVHLLADKPGALNFRVCLLSNAYRIKDRRELDSKGLRVWVLPFESDVEPDGEGLAVRGEGEALILLATGSRQELDGRFRALGLKYDGRDSFPDLTKVWDGLKKSKENESMGN
jgi:hypothetical protein